MTKPHNHFHHSHQRRQGRGENDSTCLGVRQAHLSLMENSKRPIAKAMAKRFAEALGVDYRVFL